MASISRRALLNSAVVVGAAVEVSVLASACSDAEPSGHADTNPEAAGTSVNPYSFGAIGDGANDDTSALQAAYDAAATRGGGCVSLTRGRYFIPGGLEMHRPGVSLTGSGGAVIGGGEVRVGPAEYDGSGGADFSSDHVSGIVFDRDDDYGGTRCLVLRNVRGIDVSRNLFRSAGKAIAIEAADGNRGFHTTAMVRISENRFTRLMFGVFADTRDWDTLSDWHVTDNYFNYCADTSVWIASTDQESSGGIDGLNFAGNTVFSIGHSSRDNPLFSKNRYNLRLGQTNWLRVVNNNFFEAGVSAVYLHNPINLTFVGNHIAWPGQRKLGDALEIRNGSPVGVIEGNTFSMWTRAAIGLYDLKDFSRLEIGQNGWQWSESPTSWTGDEPLPGYRVFASGDGIGYPIVRDFQDTGAYDSLKGERRQLCRDIKTPGGGITGCYRRDIQIGDGTTIFNVSDIAGRSSFGGLISVTAMSTSDQALVASYLLFVSSQGSVCTVVESGGFTDGEDAEHPSFEWSLTDGALLARPVGNAAGTYNFDAVGIGTASPS